MVLLVVASQNVFFLLVCLMSIIAHSNMGDSPDLLIEGCVISSQTEVKEKNNNLGQLVGEKLLK